MRKPSYTQDQEQFIILNSEDFTVRQFHDLFNLTIAVIHNIGVKHSLKFKRPVYLSSVRKKTVIPFVRPAAIYNQTRSPYGIASSTRIL